MKIDTPNKVIGVRALLCVSQRQLAQMIGMEVTKIHRIERGRVSIGKTISMALAGLIFEEADRYPQLLKLYKEMDYDTVADFLKTRINNNFIMSYIKHPECNRCGSMLVEIFKKPSTDDEFSFSCIQCGKEEDYRKNKNLMRLYALRTKQHIDFINPDLYYLSQPPNTKRV